jgi:type I restriction enzyme S subunit
MKMVKIKDYCAVSKGKIGISKATSGEYPLVTTAEERLSHNEYHHDKPAVIIPVVSSTGHGHASLKRIHYQDGKFAVGSILAVVTPIDETNLNAQYLYHYLNLYKEELLVSQMKGMANVTLPLKAIEEVEFPLLSIEQQHDWVELFERTQSQTDELASEITHQQDLLKKLRQQILQDAISGKLTEKWRAENPNVEPATELLKRIKAEKERLVKEKKIKKQDPLPPILEEEIPFELPEGWVWCRLGDVCTKIGSGSTPRGGNDAYVTEGIPFFRSQNIYNDGLRLNDVAYISNEIHEKMNGTRVLAGDVLLNITGGSIGRATLIENTFVDGNVSQHVCIIRPLFENSFLHKLVLSPLFQDLIPNSVTGAGREGLPKNKLELFTLPMPPVDEMLEIISSIEKIELLTNQLEQQSINSHNKKEPLMRVVLKEAFEG